MDESRQGRQNAGPSDADRRREFFRPRRTLSFRAIDPSDESLDYFRASSRTHETSQSSPRLSFAPCPSLASRCLRPAGGPTLCADLAVALRILAQMNPRQRWRRCDAEGESSDGTQRDREGCLTGFDGGAISRDDCMIRREHGSRGADDGKIYRDDGRMSQAH